MLTLTVGALMYEAGGVGPEARLICAVLSCSEVDLSELRGTSFAYPCCGCSLWMRSVLVASEADFVTSLDVGVLL